MWFIINATNRCNLDCRTCLRSKQSSGDMDLQLLKAIIPRLRVLDFSGMSVTGGEPILHPEFSELVNIIISEDFLLGVVTNGILCKEYIRILEAHKERVSFVAVSLDSHQKEINDQIRGKGSFDGATHAIKEFKRRGFFVKVSHVVNKENLKDLLQFVAFSLDLGADVINVLGTIRTPENKELVLHQKDRQDFRAMLNILRVLYKKKVSYASSAGYTDTPIFCDNFNSMNDMTLDFMGDLIFCCDTIHRGAVLGNLKTESFENLIEKHLEAQSKLKVARIRAVMDGKSRDTNNCDFCNRILKEMIKK